MLRLRADQWDRIREHFPEEHLPDSRPARKPVPIRAVLETVLWILNAGAQWHLLPQCQREMLRDILTQLANTLREEGAIDERESFIAVTCADAKGGGEVVGDALFQHMKSIPFLNRPYRSHLLLIVSPSQVTCRNDRSFLVLRRGVTCLPSFEEASSP